jgi:hypothetical protein
MNLHDGLPKRASDMPSKSASHIPLDDYGSDARNVHIAFL